MICCGLKIGISKRELLEDYYFDEIGDIFKRYSELSKISKSENKEEEEDEEVYWDKLF